MKSKEESNSFLYRARKIVDQIYDLCKTSKVSFVFASFHRENNTPVYLTSYNIDCDEVEDSEPYLLNGFIEKFESKLSEIETSEVTPPGVNSGWNHYETPKEELEVYIIDKIPSQPGMSSEVCFSKESFDHRIEQFKSQCPDFKPSVRHITGQEAKDWFREFLEIGFKKK